MWVQAANGTDSYSVLHELLTEAGTDMRLAVNCIYFVDNNDHMNEVFSGFYNTFNLEFAPPPTRTEYIGRGECADCKVVTKCIVALP